MLHKMLRNISDDGFYEKPMANQEDILSRGTKENKIRKIIGYLKEDYFMAKKTKGLVLAAATVILSSVMTVSASSADAKKVRVTTDGQSTFYQTTAKTVDEFFKANKLAYSLSYKVSAAGSDEVTDGMQIVVVSPKKVTRSSLPVRGSSASVPLPFSHAKYTLRSACRTCFR